MPRNASLRVVGALTAVVLVGGLAAAYQLGVRAHRDPSFDQGGAFLSAEDFTTPGVDGAPFPYGDATATTVASASGSVPPTTIASSSPMTTQAPTTTAVDLTTPHLAPTGTYTYAVSGTEGATALGSRSYPATASLVVHGDPGIRKDELVHDLRLSDQHEEREIVRYSPTGIAFSFEGGAITFGPGTQTSQANYSPLMVQIPFPLQVGATASGASAAKDGGKVARTEDWTAKVVGQEILDVLGQQRTTWVVDLQRQTKPGGAEQVNRFRRYWYDPVLGTWVKWTERFHASRDMLVDFTYDTTYTATLTGFVPR